MGTRFEKYSNDLAALIQNVDLDIDSDKDCYIKAADCARQAIVKSGAAPLTELEWYGGKTILRPLTLFRQVHGCGEES